MGLNETEKEILLILDKAQKFNKNIFFVASETDRSFNTIYNKVRILECKGAIIKHKTGSGKVFYIPNADVVEEIKNSKK